MDARLMFLVLSFTISILFFVHGNNSNKNDTQIQPYQQQTTPLPPQQSVPQQTQPPQIQTPEPIFSNYPAIRQPENQLGKVLSDIECHMPAGHIYRESDRVGWAHETSHGLAANLRHHFRNTSERRINAFYVLNDRAIVLNEPKTTIRNAAGYVSHQLRGMSYNTYMVRMAGSWNNQPLYICDEWVAYTNGSATRADLQINGRHESVTQMLEFTVYSLCMAMSNPERLDPQFKNFMAWHIKRAMDTYNANLNIGNISAATTYLQKIRTANDSQAESMRKFTREYLGETWVKEILGF